MTSIPASRNARAITLAPRSCPSSPGLAMITRSFRIWANLQSIFNLQSEIGNFTISDYRHFFIFAPDLAERVAHLAEGGVGAYRLQDLGHDVVGAAGRRLQAVERAAHAAVIAGPLQRLHSIELLVGRRL